MVGCTNVEDASVTDGETEPLSGVFSLPFSFA